MIKVIVIGTDPLSDQIAKSLRRHQFKVLRYEREVPDDTGLEDVKGIWVGENPLKHFGENNDTTQS